MGEQFKGMIPYKYREMSSKVVDFYGIYSETQQHMLLASLIWDGPNAQLYLKSTEDTTVGPIYVAFDGYVNTCSIPTTHFVNVEAGHQDILTVGDPYYLWQEGTLNANNKIVSNNSFLRLNNCSLFFGNFQGGVMLELTCQYNGTSEFGGITILGNCDEIINPPDE